MNTEKYWFALKITVVAEASEAVEFALNELDALGTEINNLGVEKAETLSVIGYFHESPTDETVHTELVEALRIYGFAPDAILGTDWRRIGDVDWLFEWKKHWKPTETGKFIVAPSWENVENSEKIVILIDPNMAFGTGTHETTRLCLKAVEETYTGEMSFFDVGTGTGILAIAAAKIQDKSGKLKNKIIGCDTDENSIKIAKENAVLNDVAEIEFFAGSISPETPQFDFVCANLTADVIVPLLPLLTKKFNRFLVLSGILKEQEALIIKELKNFGVENSRVETDGEWIRVLIEK